MSANPQDLDLQLPKQLVAWAEIMPDTRVILVVGSQVRQVKPAGEYSDLDVSLYVSRNDEQEDEFHVHWMRDLALSAIPQEVTSAYSLSLLPMQFSLGGWYNRLTYALGQQLAWHPLRRVIHTFRAQPGLRPASF